METDSFFCQLFKQLPQTFFEMLGLPGELARDYHFDSVELKKSFRIDGLFLPNKAGLPVYFAEVLFRRMPTFYANLFAKVFSFLNDNPSYKDWAAVAIFETRRHEPKDLDAYEDLLYSKRMTRIYLDELEIPVDPPVGLGILQLVTAPESEIERLVARVQQRAYAEYSDSEMSKKAIELTEELLLRRFTELDREEIRKMFKLQDIRKSKVWQEAREEGKVEGIKEGEEQGQTKFKRGLVQAWLTKGKSVKEIAELMDIAVKDVRRIAKEISN